MPLQRRIPKRGFRRLLRNAKRRDRFAEVNLSRLEVFVDGEMVDPARMAEAGLVRPGRKVKVLGGGELKRRLTVRAEAFSAGAREKIAAAGGSAESIQSAKG
jgi:large subunit ribosomal protein L15